MEIKVEKASTERLEELDVHSWPVWEKDISEFPWDYKEPEIFYVVEGKAILNPMGDGKVVEIEEGDIVTIPKGMKCYWKVTEKIKKHYNFG